MTIEEKKHPLQILREDIAASIALLEKNDTYTPDGDSACSVRCKEVMRYLDEISAQLRQFQLDYICRIEFGRDFATLKDVISVLTEILKSEKSSNKDSIQYCIDFIFSKINKYETI